MSIMPQKRIQANKVRQLLQLSAAENFNKFQAAKRLVIARSSARKYIMAFEQSWLTLTDIESVRGRGLFRLLFSNHRERIQSGKKVRFLDRIKFIHSRIEHDGLSVLNAWREKVATDPFGYKYSRFASLYASWRTEQGLQRRYRSKNNPVSVNPVDMHMLKKWQLSHDRRKWEVGVALLNNSQGVSSFEISRKIGRARRTIEKWCQLYDLDGITSHQVRRLKTLCKGSLESIKEKKDALIKIIHETKNHMTSIALHGV